jgi:tripartite ATP-independent transporter DctP family solute receptor
MKKRIISALLITILIVASLAACSNSGPANSDNQAGSNDQTGSNDVIRIQFGHDNLPGEPLTMAAEYWAEKLEEVSGGTMILEVYDSSSLGSKNDLLDQLMAGDAVMVVGDGGFAADYGVNDMGIIMGPYLFKNWDQVNKLVDSDLWGDLKAQLADAGMTVVGDNWQYGARSTMSTSKIESPSDFKGLKIRVPGNTVQVEGMEALGASPVTMGLSEVYSALQQGTIEAVENPLSTLLANHYDEVCKYAALDRHVYQIQFVVIGTDFFNSLTEQQQKWLVETGTEAGEYQNKLMMKAEEENIQELENRGVEITEINFDDFAEAAKSFYTDSKTSETWSDGLYERVLEIING